MKKITLISAIAAICGAANAATVYVGSDGNFYDSVSGGSQVSLSAGDTVGFQSGVTSWTVSGDCSIAALDGATAKGVTVNISGADNKLTFTTMVFNSASADSKVTFEGDGYLNFASRSFSLNGGATPTIVYNMTESSYSYKTGEPNNNVNANFIIAEGVTYTNLRFSSTDSKTLSLSLEKNARYISNGNTLNLNAANLNMAEGSYIETTLKSAGGNFRIYGSADINGTIIINGYRNASSGWGGDTYAAEFAGSTGPITFGASANVEQRRGSSDAMYRASIGGTINSYVDTAAGNYLIFAQAVSFYANTTLNLYTSDAIISKCGDFNSKEEVLNAGKTQGNSNFILRGGTTEKGVKVSVLINAYADQNFGSFDFTNDSVLKLSFNDNVISIGVLLSVNGSTINVWVDGLGEENFFISNMLKESISENVKIYDIEGNLLAENEDYYLIDGKYGEVNGVWVSSVIPEPSEIAAIIGAFMLAFAVYRRRK